jgi:ATP-dependent DNA ligase
MKDFFIIEYNTMLLYLTDTGNILVWGVSPTDELYRGMNTIQFSKFKGSREREYELKIRKGYRPLKDIVDLPFMLANNIGDIYKFIKKALEKVRVLDITQNKPMLANVYKGVDLDNIIVQPKYDGLRAAIFKITTSNVLGSESEWTILSRDGKTYVLPHITNMFARYLDNTPYENVCFDGELYIHGKPVNYIKASVPMVTKSGKISRVENDPTVVQFVAYDIRATGIDQATRLLMLENIFNGYIEVPQNNIVLSPSWKLGGRSRVYDFRDRFIKEGYEGAMIRFPDTFYKFGSRSADLLKVKKTLIGSFRCIDVIPKDKEDTALFIMENDLNSETFKCNPTGTYEVRKEALINKHKHIGNFYDVTYFSRSGVNNLPFHANVLLK